MSVIAVVGGRMSGQCRGVRVMRWAGRSSIGLGAGALLLVALALPGSAQVGGGGSVFSGTAAARLVGFDVRVSPTIGFDPLVDAGGAVAQAELNSRGQSRSFAATPYPGAAVISLPGTVSIATQGQVPADQVPEYPLYADASHPTNPSERLRVGVYDLAAASNSVDSHATATDGQTAGSAAVTSDPGTDTVVARAESSVAAFRIGELTLNGVRSSAEVRQVAGGDLERSASFEVSSITVAGQQISLTEDGLQLLDQTAPVGGVLGQALVPLLAALAEDGTTIEVLPEAELDDGITSGGLRITSTQAAPAGLASGVESVTIVYTVGSSLATVSNRALPGLTGGIAPPGVRPSAPSSSAGSAGGAIALPSATGAPRPAATAAPNAGASATGPVDPRLVASIPLDVSTFGFYPVLVAAGAALFAASRLFPYLGGRSPS